MGDAKGTTTRNCMVSSHHERSEVLVQRIVTFEWCDHPDIAIRSDDYDCAARIYPVILIPTAARSLEHILVVHKQPIR